MTELMDTLDAASPAWIDWLLVMNLWTAVLLLAVTAVDRLLSSRVGAGWRSMLYGAVLLRLLVPLDWTAPAGLAPAVTAAPVAAARPVSSAPGTIPEGVASRRPEPATLLLLAHGAIAAMLMARWARAQARLRRVARESRPVRTGGAVVSVPILEHAAWGPVIVGFLRPRVVVPSALAAGEDATLGWVLRHERAHLRRRDHLTMPLLQCLTILLWPVLAAWLALRSYRRLVEMACDAEAVAGLPAPRRRDYGAVLLALADAGGRSTWTEVSMNTDIAKRLRELRHVTRWGWASQGVLMGAMTLSLLTFLGPGAMGSVAPADASPDAVSTCRGRLETAVDQFRHLTMTSVSEGPEGLVFRIELLGVDEDHVAPVVSSFKDALDRFKLTSVSVKGLPLDVRGEEVRFPYEWVVACAEQPPPLAPALRATGFRCPDAAPDGITATRAAVDAVHRDGDGRFDAFQVSMKDGRIHVEGRADGIASIQAIMGELESCPSFADVELLSTAARKGGGYGFELAMAWRGGPAPR